MSTLAFDRQSSTITLTDAGNNNVGSWDAANNVDSHSLGPWPDGAYGFSYHKSHPDDAPDSPYGSSGIFVFDVPGRTAMGVHSGRQNSTDGAGRMGFQYCTEGCVRTTDAAMVILVETHNLDPITSLTIG